MMFTAFYSLATRPFSKDIKAEEIYLSFSHQELLARLNYLKDSRGIGMVVGEAGSGKTSGLRAFVVSLNPSLYRVAYFPFSTVTVTDFYRGLAFSLGLEPAFRKLDELQLASTKFFNDLHLLFNFSMDSENPFVLVLCGMPALGIKMSLNHNQPLNQRLIMRYKMAPLTKEETKNYLEHHMRIAGSNYPIFSDTAVEAITTVSRGWPRLINNLATTSLIYGYQKMLKYIDEEAVFLRLGFNPRTRTGCDNPVPPPALQCIVSIHAPARGATSMTLSRSVRRWFQSTHPHGVRHKI